MNSEINCKNCAAPLHGDRCAYCGTEYLSKPEISFPMFDAVDVANTLFKYVGGRIGSDSLHTPESPREGDIYFDLSLQTYRLYTNGNWVEFAD